MENAKLNFSGESLRQLHLKSHKVLKFKNQIKTENVTYVGDIIRQEASTNTKMIVSHKITKPIEKLKIFTGFNN